MPDLRDQIAALRTAAEQNIEPIIKAFDRENALKMRDEVLGFRRRFRIFAHTPGEPYLTHVKKTAEILPEYTMYMKQHPEKFSHNEVARAERLTQALTAMIKLVEENVFPFTVGA